MKKIFCILMLLTLFLGLVGCKESQPIALPSHSVLGASASLEGADNLTGAYILASDTAINILANKMLKENPEALEYISFDFGTSFALKRAGKDKLISAFDAYGFL